MTFQEPVSQARTQVNLRKHAQLTLTKARYLLFFGGLALLEREKGFEPSTLTLAT